VMGSVSSDQVSIASGVNNAIARTAGLASISVIPVVSGLTTAAGAADVTDSFRISLIITALVAAAAAPVCFVGLRGRVRCAPSARRLHCAVDGPPLQPDPRQCPVPAGG